MVQQMEELGGPVRHVVGVEDLLETWPRRNQIRIRRAWRSNGLSAFRPCLRALAVEAALGQV